MSIIQDNYIDYLKVQTPSDAAASVNRILADNPDVTIPDELACHGEWTTKSDTDKEIYENEITDALFAAIAEVDHPLWEAAFETEGVVFTGGETLPDKCRKRRPQT